MVKKIREKINCVIVLSVASNITMGFLDKLRHKKDDTAEESVE